MPNDDDFEDGKNSPAGTALTADATDLSPGKHAILAVPDFKIAANTGGTAMNSYLRLGDAHTEAGPATGTHAIRVDLGEDLASMVQGFTDDRRDRGNGTESNRPGMETSSSPPGTGTTVGPMTTEQRRAESKLLHRKGGWRDHSDGNRITTTRGDKIEVIRGNYKMLVLGRNDDFYNVAGVEMAGGNVDTSSSDLSFASQADQPPDDSRDVAALQTTFEWFQAPDRQWGWRQTVKSGDPASRLGTNGQLITQTWVDLSQTDLTARQVSSTTTATNVTSVVNATDVSSFVSATSTVDSTTQSDGSMTNNVSGGALSNVTSVGAISDFTACGVHSAVEILVAEFNGNLFAGRAGLDIGMVDAYAEIAVLIANIQVATTAITMLVGTAIDTHAGTHLDHHPVIHVDDHSGVHMDLHIGEHVQYDLGDPIKITVGLATALHAAQQVSITNGVVTADGANIITISSMHVVA